MSGEASKHYERLLARHYSWMVGMPFAAKMEEQRALLERLGCGGTGLAVDAGSGPGYQTAALLGLGYAPVLAIDTSAELLAELTAALHDRPVEAVEGDIAELGRFAKPGSARIVVCMGDTLTHLPGRDAVERFVAAAFTVLQPGGTLAVTYRDLSAALEGTDRFLPIRADDERIMTCFLEWQGDRVMVHDLIHVRGEAGWTLTKSAYPKLVLPVVWLSATIERAGFSVERNEAALRMTALVARKRG